MSKMGLEYFYYRLRDLILDKDELTRLQEKRKIYKDREKDLEDLQFQLGKLGHFKEDLLELVEEEIKIQRELALAARIFSFTALYILILFITLRAQAILFIFGLLAANTFIYKKFKEMTLGKLDTLVRLKSLLNVSEVLIKNKSQVFTEEIREIENILTELGPLKKSFESN